MTDKADHISWATEAVSVFQRRCGTGDEHVIADLICDLGHLADERGLDFLEEVARGVGHWHAEHKVRVTEAISDRMPSLKSKLNRNSSRRQSSPIMSLAVQCCRIRRTHFLRCGMNS